MKTTVKIVMIGHLAELLFSVNKRKKENAWTGHSSDNVRINFKKRNCQKSYHHFIIVAYSVEWNYHHLNRFRLLKKRFFHHNNKRFCTVFKFSDNIH